MTNYSAEKLRKIWNKGHVIPGSDPNMLRRDQEGNTIKRSAYGREIEHGWEVDHIIPLARGGPNSIDNLQPLQWKANREKSDN